jgi:hypothetical protein
VNQDYQGKQIADAHSIATGLSMSLADILRLRQSRFLPHSRLFSPILCSVASSANFRWEESEGCLANHCDSFIHAKICSVLGQFEQESRNLENFMKSSPRNAQNNSVRSSQLFFIRKKAAPLHKKLLMPETIA